ncbi:run domain Beclin-1-interacting and cysteine-rich domain-containing protein [Neodiprion lecontei]|uniref:Run domain Beclin-1-interacting and cysteine-rich domain-containing protein n=1 Tax=Neodiprion lecontei TaxID=441921 RepID=A0A6J0C776_NEOLC|nr:run domain Beclin-1-interacting and cysteine-rich domain-containing protein [Neodiprion lecontei]XP_046588428.1 run domain Beclin-1-interacting and cysteine-rich domain-containing protein [Neodiprion lecontei]
MMTSMQDPHIREHQQLLQYLRSTVEGLLVSQVSNVWNVYGGLNRLHKCMERIFRHGSRVFDSMGEPDCWIFIQGLNWLQPSLATSPSVHESDDYLSNIPVKIGSRKDLLWLYKSLESHSLSQKLSWLLSDKEHLLSCLEPWAFLCQESLAEATLICLRAVEKNQPSLLTEIDPCLFLPNWDLGKNSPNRHRRSSSYPTNLSYKKWGIVNIENTNSYEKYHTGIAGSTAQSNLNDRKISENPSSIMKERKCKINSEPVITKTDIDFSLKVWSSLPTLNENHENLHNLTIPQPTSPAKFFIGTNRTSYSCSTDSYKLSNVIKVDYTEVQSKGTTSNVDGKVFKKNSPVRKSRKKVKILHDKQLDMKSSDGSSDTLNYDDNIVKSVTEALPKSPKKPVEFKLKNLTSNTIKIGATRKTDIRKTTLLPDSAPEFTGSWSSEVEGQKDYRTPKKSFMEDGGSSVQPMATGYFPRPLEGQSLTSFLSSAQFTRANAELDRENAHFSISEAMIAAIEQVKCNNQLNLVDEIIDESDEEINNLKQRIRLRRRQRQQEKQRGAWSRDLLSDGKTDTTTTDQSVSPLSTSPGTPSESISTDDVDDLEVGDIRNISQLRNSGLSMSMGPLYSEAELCRTLTRHGTESTLTESIVSAEGVALCLIRRFSEKQLPRASELEWLVSEQDAPQQLLPLPTSWPVSPDEAENEDMTQATLLRGTMEWAPPRPQIIFTPQPAPVRRILMAKQNYRCAGCGMKVAVEYANRFRYCEYLGRYFCTGCHTNQLTILPGKILSKWDFNRYSVSNFSYRLLDQMTADPLFQVNDLNPLLYRRIKQLEKTRILRTQLFYLKDFLFTCRFAVELQEALHNEPIYILNDPHVYAIQDFVQVKVGLLPERLKDLVEACSSHVVQCELCQARGFVCELCCSKEIIFPWQVLKVMRCDDCGACFHAHCKQKSSRKECPRCKRLEARRTPMEETS